MRKKKYLVGYIICILAIISIYFVINVEADTSINVIFATRDLAPGSILEHGDIEFRSGTVLDAEKDRVWYQDQVEDLIGMQISPYGVREGRPLLIHDVTKPKEQLFEMKMVGDITIPEDAKVVNVSMIFDQRNFPGEAPKLIAEHIPVKRIYNNQNVPIDMTDSKMNRVPKAISIYVTEAQKDNILKHQNMGVFVFTTIP